MTNIQPEPNVLDQPGKLALIHGRVVLPERVMDGMAVIIDQAAGRIADIIAETRLPESIARMDVDGRWITPGLIDIHTHGALGHTFNEPDAAAFTTILQENARRGVTGLLATVAPAPMEDLLQV